MPLHYPPPPATAGDALKRGLATQQGRPGGDLAILGGTKTSKPIPVYTLGLKQLEEGKSANDAHLAVWRYLLVVGDKVRQIGDVAIDAEGHCRFGSLTNAYTGDLVEAFARAESLPEVANRDYELRWLSIPTFHLLALWLKNQQGDEDRFVLLSPAPAGMEALTVYKSGELFPLLRQKANRKRATSRRVSPPG